SSKRGYARSEMLMRMLRPIYNRRQVANLPYITVALFLGTVQAQGLKQVAITIDDLPHGGTGIAYTFPELQRFTKEFLDPLEHARVPFIGFVNERRRATLNPAQLRSLLDMWLESGGDLGNHTATHPDLNRISLEKYEQDILAGEAVTRATLEAEGRKLRYFRHPFLHAGQDLVTKHGLEQCLAAHGCTESAEYMKVRYAEGMVARPGRPIDYWLPYTAGLFVDS